MRRRTRTTSRRVGAPAVFGVTALAIMFTAIGAAQADRRPSAAHEVRWQPLPELELPHGLEPLAAEVEELRGLDFQWPVATELEDLSGAAPSVQTQGAALWRLDRATGRALGLASGASPDSTESASGDATRPALYNIARFDEDRDVIVIDTDAARTAGPHDTESAMAHALTLALQRQNFALDPGHHETRSRIPELRVADASRVATQLRRAHDLPPGDVEAGSPLDALAGADRILGEVWALQIFESGGRRMLDRALAGREPLPSSAAFDPFGPTATATRPDDTDPPGRRTTGPSQLGPVALQLMFAAHMDIHSATVATRGWHADALALGRIDDHVCFSAAIAVDSARDLDELEGAAAVWRDRGPEGAHRYARRIGGEIEIGGCDPGPGAEIPIVDDPIGALDYAAAWNRYSVLLIEAGGFPRAQALCVTPHVMAAIGLDDVAEIDGRGSDAEIARSIFTQPHVLRALGRSRGQCQVI